LLKSIEDVSRISQRFLLGKGTTDDLVSIRNTIQIWETIRSTFAVDQDYESRTNPDQSPVAWDSLNRLLMKIVDLRGVADRIALAVDCNEASQVPSVSEDEEYELQVEGKPAQEAFKLTALPLSDFKWTIRPRCVVSWIRPKLY
jgi:hypothetical protein